MAFPETDQTVPATGVAADITGPLNAALTKIGRNGATNMASLDYRVAVLEEAAVDPQQTRFAGGAKFDNSTDDTAALQAAINHAGDTSTARAGNIKWPKGTAVHSDTLLFERKAMQVSGEGWSPLGGAGSTFRWTGPNTKPQMRIRQGMGMSMRDFRLHGNKTAANRPTAGIDLNVDADTQQQPNTLMTFDRIWFGPYDGYDEPIPGAGHFVSPYPYYLQAGIASSGAEPAEDNLQNDISRFFGCTFYLCQDGYSMWTTPPGNTQAVINKILSCDFHYCGTGVRSPAQTMLDNVYFAWSDVTDLHIFQDRFTCFNLTSEFAKRGCIIENNGELIVHTGYFQLGENVHADGRAYLGVNDTRTLMDFSYFDFRYYDTAYASTHTVNNVLTPPKAFSLKTATAGPQAHKILHMNHVNWGVGGLRQNITEAHLDVNPSNGGGFADDLLVYGMIQGPPDFSGQGATREIYNYCNYTRQTLDFNRNDRIVPLRHTTAGGVADSDYITPPPIGTQVLDTGNSPPRIYTRTGVNTWRYVTLT